MKRVFKNLLVILLLFILVLVVVGCKKKEQTNKPATQPTEPTITEPDTYSLSDFVVLIDGAEFKADSPFKMTEGDVATVTIKNKKNNEVFSDYQVFLNSEIVSFEGTSVKALKEGSGTAVIVITIGEENYRISLEVVVEKGKEPTPTPPTPTPPTPTPTETEEEYTFETNIPDRMYSFQTVKDVTLTLNPGNINITDFKVKVSDSDVIDYMDDNSIETIDNGTVTITFTSL